MTKLSVFVWWIAASFLVSCASPVTERRARMVALSTTTWHELPAAAFSMRLLSQFSVGGTNTDGARVESDLLHEIGDPWWKDVDYLVRLRVGLIRIAARKARTLGAVSETGFEEVSVDRWFEEGKTLAVQRIDLLARLYHARAEYRIATGILGKSIDDLRNAQEATQIFAKRFPKQETEQKLLSMLAEDGLATAYCAIHEKKECTAHRGIAIEQAQKADLSIVSINSEFQHEAARVLLAAMEESSINYQTEAQSTMQGQSLRKRNAEFYSRMQRLIENSLPVGARYTVHFPAMLALHRAGDVDNSRALLFRWPEDQVERYHQRFFSMDEVIAWHCTFGEMLMQSHEWAAARSHLDYCLQYSQRITPKTRQRAAQANEELGDFRAAKQLYIDSRDAFESVRNSYQTKNLTHFFNAEFRGAYHGLIRLALKESPLSKGVPGTASETTIDELLTRSEEIRARQFRDRLAQSSKQQLDSSVRVSAIRSRLQSDDILLVYIALDDELILLSVSHERLALKRVPIDRLETASRVSSLLALLNHPAGTEQKRLLFSELVALSKQILPERELFQGKRRILLVTDGPMGQIPFEVLSFADKASLYDPLVKGYAVLNLASLSVWLNRPLHERTRRNGSTLLALADPDIDQDRTYSLASLYNTRGEVDTIRNALGIGKEQEDGQSGVAFSMEECKQGTRSCLLFGGEAQLTFLKENDLRRFSVVYLATHGLAPFSSPQDALLKQRQVTLDQPALLLSSGNGQGALLSASDAETLQLQADLTVLAACQTGVGEQVIGEGTLGMGRALLMVSRAVLMSLWKVDNTFTQQLMQLFIAHWSSSSNLRDPDRIAEALAEAKRQMLAALEQSSRAVVRNGSNGSAWESAAETLPPHPYYWAPFVAMAR